MQAETIITGMPNVDAATTLLRTSVGVFFAISGANKLFVPSRREQIRQTMHDLHIPLPDFNARFVPIVELTAGLGLALGLLTVPSALALLVICIVACITDGPRKVQAFSPINPADWLACLLYLPEVLLGLALAAILLLGPDKWTADSGLELSRVVHHLTR